MSVTTCAIVINYFGADKTSRCVESLISEPLTTLLLVDNSADEHQRGSLSALADQTRDSAARFTVKTLYNDQNLGFGHAINNAIGQDLRDTGGHDYYLLMNNDAEASPGLIDGLLQATRDDPALGLVSPLIHWGRGEVRYHWYQPLLGHVTTNAFPGSFKYLSGCCLLVDRTLVADGALFSGDFFMYGEDVELTAKALRKGKQIACMEHLSVEHEGSGSSRNGSYFYEYHVARAHLLLAKSLARNGIQSLLYRLGRLMYLPARASLRSLRSRSTTPLRALVAAYTHSTARAHPTPRMMGATRDNRV